MGGVGVAELGRVGESGGVAGLLEGGGGEAGLVGLERAGRVGPGGFCATREGRREEAATDAPAATDATAAVPTRHPPAACAHCKICYGMIW